MKDDGQVLPTVVTAAISSIGSTTASSGGNVVNDGGSLITSRGICWSTSTLPTTADNKTTSLGTIGIFTSTLTGLISNTIYYVRAYAINSVGIAYGNEISFTTSSGGPTVTDVDGNVYNTVTIGTRVWMKENLKTTKYNDNSVIPLVSNATSWSNLSTPVYCWYNNDEATYKATYGALYNWYSVNTGKLCPVGWYVPTDAEWKTLTTYLGGDSVAGGKLKEAGTVHWRNPNTGATNISGFTALPGGYRYSIGTFSSIEVHGSWWSSTEWDAHGVMARNMGYNFAYVYWSNSSKVGGFSVRCIKDIGSP